MTWITSAEARLSLHAQAKDALQAVYTAGRPTTHVTLPHRSARHERERDTTATRSVFAVRALSGQHRRPDPASDDEITSGGIVAAGHVP